MPIFSRYTWWVGAMVALALVLTMASTVGVLNPLQSVFLTVTSPIERGFGAIFRPVAGLLGDAGNIGPLRKENRELRLENERLLNEVAELEQFRERVKELEAALNITTTETGTQRLIASVVHRESSPFTDVMSIDKGEADGVKPGMVVVSTQGTLLGTVTRVAGNRSFVRLITDSKSKVAAEVQGSGVEGIVKGTANRVLEFDLAQSEVKVGEIVTTSALTGRYPAGISIARVSEVGGTAQDLFRTVKLEPIVRISTARTVLVITNFLPQGVELAP